jgi:hypothetical protein
MLTYEIMGLLALGIIWVNTLLLAGAALTPLGDLLGRLRRWRNSGLMRATVVEGAEDGVFARYEVEQTGHKAADDDKRAAIAFHDRAYRSFVYGGRVEVEGEALEVSLPEAGRDGEVWVSAAEKAQDAACPDADAFEVAYRSSRKAKGWRRTVRHDVTVGDEVFVHLRRDGDRLVAPEGGPVVCATFDPRPWCRAKAALVVGFQLLVLVLAGAITYLALYPPLFGTVSTIGGVAGLIYFVTIQPVGVSVRETTLAPPVAALRGSWLRPEDQTSPRAARPLPNGT